MLVRSVAGEKEFRGGRVIGWQCLRALFRVGQLLIVGRATTK